MNIHLRFMLVFLSSVVLEPSNQEYHNIKKHAVMMICKAPLHQRHNIAFLQDFFIARMKGINKTNVSGYLSPKYIAFYFAKNATSYM